MSKVKQWYRLPGDNPRNQTQNFQEYVAAWQAIAAVLEKAMPGFRILGWDPFFQLVPDNAPGIQFTLKQALAIREGLKNVFMIGFDSGRASLQRCNAEQEAESFINGLGSAFQKESRRRVAKFQKKKKA